MCNPRDVRRKADVRRPEQVTFTERRRRPGDAWQATVVRVDDVARRAAIRARPRVVIADQHAPTRLAARLALERDGFVVSAEEKTASAAIAAALRDRPDLCLLDIHIAGGGIEATEAIHSQLPRTHVVLLVRSRDDDHLFAALDAGASGYLLKDASPARLGAALRGVLRGEAALPRELTGRLISEFRARSRDRESALVRRGKNDLTPREWEVLDCLCEGLPTRRIAERLFISPTTVRRHIGSILAKLNVPTRQAAVDLVAGAHEI
jgi:two-component system nitrate/nitrite response regulator NarL